MLIDAGSGNAPATLDADVVIAGAGTVGLFLATALARAGKRVVVLESGPAVAAVTATADAAATGRRQDGIRDGRAKGLGGTSVLWGGQLAEFDTADFIQPHAPWPLTRSDLEPWYARVYARLGIRAQPDGAYRRRLGEEQESGGPIERFFTYWLPEPNFARFFRRDILTEPRLTVVLGATVNGIVFAGNRAEAITAGGAEKALRVTARDFVFSLGTVGTVRFFLSTARDGDVPWRDQPLIGTGFQDHLGGAVARVTVDDETRFRNFFENAVVDGLKLQPKLRPSATARGVDALGISGSFAFNSDLSAHLANIKHVARALRSAAGLSSVAKLPAAVLAVGRSFAPFIWRYLRDRRVMAFFDKSLDFHVQCEQRPLATSRITLAGDASAADGLYPVAVDWQVDGGEIDGIVRFAAAVDDYLRDTGIGRLDIDPRVVERDPAFVDSLIDTIHHAGGMAMGTGSDTGVVDRDLRVFGTDNVFVAGAAVFPTSSHANVTLTALALAERLGDHLQNRGEG